MGIENYVPVQRKTHLWSDRRKQIDHIVIPMKIFVRVDAQEQKDVLMLSAVSRYMVDVYKRQISGFSAWSRGVRSLARRKSGR